MTLDVDVSRHNTTPHRPATMRPEDSGHGPDMALYARTRPGADYAGTGEATSWTRWMMAATITQNTLDAAASSHGRLRSALMAGCSVPGQFATHIKAFPSTADQVCAVRDFVSAALAGHPVMHDAAAAASALAADAITHSASGLFLVHLTEISGNHVGVIITNQGEPNAPETGAASSDVGRGPTLRTAASVTALCLTIDNEATRSVIAIIPATRSCAALDTSHLPLVVLRLKRRSVPNMRSRIAARSLTCLRLKVSALWSQPAVTGGLKSELNAPVVNDAWRTAKNISARCSADSGEPQIPGTGSDQSVCCSPS